MSKSLKYYSISYGHLVASWHIIFLVQKYKSITARDVISIVEKSGKMGGTVPAKQGLKICTDYELIAFHDEILQLTDKCNNILKLCDNEDIGTLGLRAFLFHILSYHNFEWLILFDTDPGIFRESLLNNDPEWLELLNNAELFDFDQEDVINWWDKILSKYEDYKAAAKKAIGDVGERLTYHHELRRIEIDGFTPPKLYVKWASRISDRFGFDVLSIRGNRFLSSWKINEKIQIEVKSSDTSNPEKFRFFITKYEWNKALENINSYFFFCWTGININEDTAKSGPHVVPATDFIDHVPKDNGGLIEWSECRCVLDLRKYPIFQ